MQLYKLCALALVMTLGACGNLRAIHFNEGLDTNRLVMVDSNQRGIVTGDFDDSRAMCAEPSPDTTSVMALAASANLSRSQAAQIQAALSMSESAMNIGLRTPTIQLLRDGMYRLCEAYMNGAIDRSRYTVLINRYQQMMIGLVAIEQLTGVVRTSQNRIQAGQASTTGSLAALRVDAVAERQHLEERMDAAHARMVAIGDPGPAAAEDTQEIRDRRAEYTRLQAEFDMYRTAVANQAAAVADIAKATPEASTNNTGAGQGAGGSDRDPTNSNTTIPAHVSQAVERITRSITRANMGEFACLPTYDWLMPNDRPVGAEEGASEAARYRRYALTECLNMATADAQGRVQEDLALALAAAAHPTPGNSDVEHAERAVENAARESATRTQGIVNAPE